MKILGKLIIIFWLMAIVSTPIRAELRWHWESSFSEDEKRRLTSWIEQTYHAITMSVAPYPFDVHIHFYRLADTTGPVPWANTRRSDPQGVNFHVDPNFSTSQFMNDWTAAHELSHLLLPYLGRDNSWYAEGFASFMQYQILHALNLLSKEAIDAEYQRRLDKAESNYTFDQLPFALTAKKLRAQRKYPTMYWGGAAYFLKVDQALRANGGSLLKTLQDYIECCRQNSSDLNTLTQDLDRISGMDTFSHELSVFQFQPGFPKYTPQP